MIDGLRLELRDVAPIARADLDINRINIVGGKNGTGKSTASKLLYCFLKANSSDKFQLVKLIIRDELYDIWTYFNSLDKRDPILSKIAHNIREMNRKLYSPNIYSMYEVNDLFDEIEPSLTNFFKKAEFDKSEFDGRVTRRYAEPTTESVYFRVRKIKRILNDIKEDSFDFFKESMRVLLSSEFDMDLNYGTESNQTPNYRINYAKFYDFLNSNFSFEVKLNDVGKEFESKGKFFASNVVYLESFSIYDDFSNSIQCYHIQDLIGHLPNAVYMDYDDDQIPIDLYKVKSGSMDELEKRINNIVGGTIVEDIEDEEWHFVSNDSAYSSIMKNTASGIKQLAFIQTLLLNHSLGEEGVLIIDEPEVNLHPEWQVKFARILVLLAKERNITLYINTHSPMFIEAMDTFSEYYDFEEYVNYYLTEKSEDDKNMFEFKKVPSDELYLIYDNLGDPYDYLDRVRLSKGRGESIDDLDF